VINSNHLKQYHKADVSYEITQRSGLYFKVSKKFIARKFEDKLGPYFGVFISNGLGFEKGVYKPLIPFSTSKGLVEQTFLHQRFRKKLNGLLPSRSAKAKVPKVCSQLVSLINYKIGFPYTPERNYRLWSFLLSNGGE
jgi:hypothetical protein